MTAFYLIVVVVALVAVYMVIAARKAPAVDTMVVTLDKRLQRNVTVAHISDVHLGFFYSLTRFRAVVDQLNSLNADLVVITGDLLDDASRFGDYDGLAHELSRIHSRWGVFAIIGNHERPHRACETLLHTYRRAGVECLVNRGCCIDKAGVHLHVYGADCAMFGRRDARFVYALPSQAVVLLLVHQPDAIEDYLDLPIDIALSGHTHNGQVNFWGFRPILPRMAKRFVDGNNRHRGKYGSIFHHVNRGLGVTHLPLRFNSRPQISRIVIQSTST